MTTNLPPRDPPTPSPFAKRRPRPGRLIDPTAATKRSLSSIAARVQDLDEEIAELDDDLDALLTPLAPRLLDLQGVGLDVAGQLLVTAGDNPDRIGSEAAFAHLCGAAPIPASSGKTANRHRLNRGGDRAANAALYRIVMCRLRWDPRTRAYVDRRTKQGRSKKEIIRCLKRYIAREVFTAIQAAKSPLDIHRSIPVHAADTIAAMTRQPARSRSRWRRAHARPTTRP